MKPPPPGPPPSVVPVASVDEARESVAVVTAGLEATMQRAAALADDDRHRRMNDEWSTVESLRHVVFVLDLWLSKVILGEQDPFDPMGLPPTFMPARFPDSSIDPDARPSFDEACRVLEGRLAGLGSYVDGLSPEELDRPVKAHARTVGGALCVVFTELKAHTRFINRDLDLITA